jgi:putative acetyltransferase
MQIRMEQPDQPDVIGLIEELDAYQMPLYPLESHHGIDIAALSQPNVIFAVARDDFGTAVACGAIVLEANYGEIKRMYVRPENRGKGIGKKLLQMLETEAGSRGCRLFALETGISQPEATTLYEKAGYSYCEPFGPYKPDPYSVFMQKADSP